MSIENVMSIVKFPYCHHDFQINEDYYGYGDSFPCPKCEQEIYIVGKASIVYFNLSTKPDNLKNKQKTS